MMNVVDVGSLYTGILNVLSMIRICQSEHLYLLVVSLLYHCDSKELGLCVCDRLYQASLVLTI